MPSLRNILHKHESQSTEKSPVQSSEQQVPTPTSPPPPEITFLRSDTFGHEVITPPDHQDPQTEYFSKQEDNQQTTSPPITSSPRRSFQLFRRSSSRSASLSGGSSSSPQPRRERRLSNLLHLDHRSRSNSRDSSSTNIPQDLPQIEDDDEQGGDEKDREAQWEKRATVLVQKNPHFAQSATTNRSQGDLRPGSMPRSRSSSSVGDQQDDVSWFCCGGRNLQLLILMICIM